MPWDGPNCSPCFSRDASVIGFNGSPSHVDREYDALGRLRRESEPFTGSPQYWTTYSYDILGRVTQVTQITQITHSDNSQSSVRYNGLSRTETNGLGQTRTEERNVAGELVRVIDHMGGYVEYDYDPQGNLKTALQGGPGVTPVLTSLSHDLRGRKTAMTARGQNTSNV